MTKHIPVRVSPLLHNVTCSRATTQRNVFSYLSGERRHQGAGPIHLPLGPDRGLVAGDPHLLQALGDRLDALVGLCVGRSWRQRTRTTRREVRQTGRDVSWTKSYRLPCRHDKQTDTLE